MAAGKFKAQCLSVIDDVHDLKEEVVITKHGKPMAKLIPIKRGSAGIFGAMRGLGRITGDLVEPITLPEDWDQDLFPAESARRKR
jgi:prevent-host-death family protein